MFNHNYSVANYNYLASQEYDLEDQYDKLYDLFIKEDDEDVAEDLYGADLREIEEQLENVRSAMAEIDTYWLTQDYYRSVI